MFDTVKGLNASVVKEVGSLSKDVAPLIATLVKEHRLTVIVLMVMKVMDEVRQIDEDADRAIGL